MRFFLKIFRLLPPEIAHKIALDLLNLSHKLGILSFIFRKPKDENCSFAGMNLSNRLGTAAGLDKNGDYIDCLGALGFGFLEVGTITVLPQEGNPKPRIFRLPEDKAIINRNGFNNDGIILIKNRYGENRYFCSEEHIQARKKADPKPVLRRGGGYMDYGYGVCTKNGWVTKSLDDL